MEKSKLKNSKLKNGKLVLCSLLAAMALVGCGSKGDNGAAVDNAPLSDQQTLSDDTANRSKTERVSATSQPQKADRKAAKQGSSPIAGIPMTYKFRTNGLGSTVMKGKGLMTFRDGTFTDDFEGMVRGNAAESMRNNPDDWGTWRIDGDGKFYYRFNRSERWLSTHSSTPSIPLEGKATLNGCYKAISSINMPENRSSLSVNTFCFNENGLFTNDASRSTLLSPGASGSARNTSGEYLIKGPIMVLKYGDGTIAPRIIGLYGNNTSSVHTISINGTPFFEED